MIMGNARSQQAYFQIIIVNLLKWFEGTDTRLKKSIQTDCAVAETRLNKDALWATSLRLLPVFCCFRTFVIQLDCY